MTLAALMRNVSVPSMDRAGRNGTPIAAAWKPHGQGVIGPLADLDRAGFHHPPGVRRQAARLQADDVGDIHLGERPAAAGQVAGTEDLEIVRGGVAGEGEVLLALAQDFVDDGDRQPVAAEAADGEVVAVVDQPADGVGDGRELVGERARLVAEGGAKGVGRRVGEERAGCRRGEGHRIWVLWVLSDS